MYSAIFNGRCCFRARKIEVRAWRLILQKTFGLRMSRPIAKGLPKVIWEEGRVAAVSHTGRAVASMRSRNAVGKCGVAFIHEYAWIS